MKNKKPNCYKCKYRGTVAGSYRSSCLHPLFREAYDDPFLKVLAIFAGVGKFPPMQIKEKNIKIVGNSHGIKKDWFNHPFNFDPIWLEECNGFKLKGDNNE